MGGTSSASSPAEAWSAAGRLLTPGAWAATGIAAVSVLALGWFLVPLAIDAIRPAPAPLKKIDDPQKNAEQQKVTFDGYMAQVKGRSLFYLPPPPQASTASTDAKDADKPPPPPSSYGGPSIVAMLSDVVWFSNGRKMKLGEKHDDLEVVALSPPWSSRLKWKGVEFDVGFFERSRLTKSPTEPAPAKAEEPKEPATESPDAASPSKTEATPEAKPTSGSPRDSRPEQARDGRDRRPEGGRRGRGGEPR
ncbi:MAG: hypothetical protein WCK33_11735 [Phycisphaerae bacterium]|jgi:hypothetical protein